MQNNLSTGVQYKGREQVMVLYFHHTSLVTGKLFCDVISVSVNRSVQSGLVWKCHLSPAVSSLPKAAIWTQIIGALKSPG